MSVQKVRIVDDWLHNSLFLNCFHLSIWISLRLLRKSSAFCLAVLATFLTSLLMTLTSDSNVGRSISRNSSRVIMALIEAFIPTVRRVQTWVEWLTQSILTIIHKSSSLMPSPLSMVLCSPPGCASQEGQWLVGVWIYNDSWTIWCPCCSYTLNVSSY